MSTAIVLLLVWVVSAFFATRTLLFGKGKIREDRLVVGALLIVFGSIICLACGFFVAVHYADPIPSRPPILSVAFYAGYAAMIVGLLSVAFHRKTNRSHT